MWYPCDLTACQWSDWFWTAIFLFKITITLYSLDTSCRSVLIYTAIHYCFLFSFNIRFSILLLSLPTSLHNMLLLKLPSSPIFVTYLCLGFLHRWTKSVVCSAFLANCFPNSATVWRGFMSCSANKDCSWSAHWCYTDNFIAPCGCQRPGSATLNKLLLLLMN